MAKTKSKPEKVGRRAAKAAAGDDEGAASSLSKHPKQRYVWIGDRWLYEILPGQVLGCPSCRYIFNGCTMCDKPNYRGKTAAKMLEDEDYQYGLTWLDEKGVDIIDPPAEEIENVPAAPKKKGRKSKADV